MEKYGNEWQKYDYDYGYDKREYDIKVYTGEIYLNCYPNADVFIPCAEPNKYQHIPEMNVIMIRLSENPILGINNNEDPI